MAVKCILTGQTPSVLDGVEQNVQDQLDSKQDKITANGILQGDGAGNITAAEITKDTVGLSNVDNTSDADKPISTATQTALDDKVNANYGQVYNRLSFYYRPSTSETAETGKIDATSPSIGLRLIGPGSNPSMIQVASDKVSIRRGPDRGTLSIAEPATATDATTKYYVDTQVSTKQDKITAQGVLKGDSEGNISSIAVATFVELSDIDNIGEIQSGDEVSY